MEFSSIYSFLQAAPESAGLIALSLALAGVPLCWGRILVFGSIMTLLVLLIRSLPVSFGLHIIVGILLIVIYLIKTTNVRPVNCFFAVFVSYTTLAVLELIAWKIILSMGVDPELLLVNPAWKLLGLIQVMPLILLAIITSKLKKPARNYGG